MTAVGLMCVYILPYLPRLCISLLLDYFHWKKGKKTLYFLYCVYSTGAFRLYDVDNDGFITRDEMYNIVDAIYQMVVSGKDWKPISNLFLYKKKIRITCM